MWYYKNMNKIATAFKEHKEFKKNKPWDANVMTFKTNVITPPHYAETIEILIYDNVEGDAHIGGQHFSINGRQVYFVAPNVVHAMYYKPNEGKDITLKINPAQLKPIFDIEEFLSHCGISYEDLPVFLPEFDFFCGIADTFMNQNDISEIIIAVIKLFKLLISYALQSKEVSKSVLPHNEDLRYIIKWTEENFKEKISLEDISKKMGYNKEYFCRKFKKLTGITYLAYLNNTRIYHACKLLKKGYSISDACDGCGFEDLSYFTQLFKKIMGTTPKKYISQIQKQTDI